MALFGGWSRGAREEARLRLVAALEAAGLEVKTPEVATDLAQAPDLVVTVGGDGTLLDAVRRFRVWGAPFFAVNAGHLGFLSAVSLDQLDAAVDHVRRGDWIEMEAPLLRVLTEPADETGAPLPPQPFDCLNDLVVERGSPRTLTLSVRVAELEMAPVVGDGLVVATPLGSTAYARAAGGPMLHPALRAFQVVGLNLHHSVHTRYVDTPLVLPPGHTLEIVNLRPHDRRAQLTADGRVVAENFLRCTVAWIDEGVRLAYLPGFSYLKRAEAVLWGPPAPRG
ncbi:inorganic polyphosphate kinase [Limnochorda pilosa]|uniref:NAD kinase n=1 Tax=Limnochorda pilosa TaxID=1555112 RepID=A0A0K2SP38_LIMPI|nr:inorganic polyphosphate kinase [Limnochorda pilosa]